MITNIVDVRKNSYKFKKVWGVVEPTCNDNSCKDADMSVIDVTRLGFIEWTKTEMLFSDLIEWANKFKGENTLYVYETDPMAITKVVFPNETS